MRKVLYALALAAAALSVLPAAHAQAQPWPTRPVCLVVPYAVGQGTDIAARFIVEELGKELKQPGT